MLKGVKALQRPLLQTFDAAVGINHPGEKIGVTL
jgi:hypothetical protein